MISDIETSFYQWIIRAEYRRRKDDFREKAAAFRQHHPDVGFVQMIDFSEFPSPALEIDILSRFFNKYPNCNVNFDGDLEGDVLHLGKLGGRFVSGEARIHVFV